MYTAQHTVRGDKGGTQVNLYPSEAVISHVHCLQEAIVTS